MDSNQVRAIREPWQARRLSTDIKAVQATMAARATRRKRTIDYGTDPKLIKPRFSTAVQDEDRLPLGQAGNKYQQYRASLRETLASMSDDKGSKLYSTHQIIAQMDDESPLSEPSDRSFGEVGGITYFTKTDFGTVDHMHEAIPVADMIKSTKGFEEMDRRWKSAFDSTESSFRWIHLPANNMEWTQGAIGQILRHYVIPKDNDDEIDSDTLLASLEEQILRPELWEDQQNNGLPELPHARFMRAFCRKIDATTSSTQNHSSRGLRRAPTWRNADFDRSVPSFFDNSMVIFVPYLHWESTLSYHHMKSVIQDVDAGGLGSFGGPDIAGLPCGVDEKLMRHHLQRLAPMHVRRTLDQFDTIADTSSRDKDQVVEKYFRVHHESEFTVPPMLMVDQLWLWIINGDTILTCFPHRWNKNAGQHDSTCVYEACLELLDDDLHTSKFSAPEQLAYLIIDRCTGNVLERELILDENLRFLDFFDWSIDDLNERQSKCLQALWQDVQSSSEEGADGLIDISKEFDILEKIKDVIDELQIILRLIDQQLHAFGMVAAIAPPIDVSDHNSDVTDDGGETPSHDRSRNPEFVDFGRLEERARSRGDVIRAMIERAQTTYDSVLDILSLKQQQANISEARSSRRAAQEMEKMAKEAKKAAEESEKQGYSIMLFTLVTIFFLPMSSIASLFGVNAVEFGQGKIHFSTIMAYIMPISVFVVYISFLLAFNHKARRSLLLVLQIWRAYINLALPIVFDEHKESKLHLKLEKLKARRHQQRERKAAKIRALEEEKRVKEEAFVMEDGENDAGGSGISGEATLEGHENSVHSTGHRPGMLGTYKWASFRSGQKPADAESGDNPPVSTTP